MTALRLALDLDLDLDCSLRPSSSLIAHFDRLSLRAVLLIASLIRVALIVYGVFHDSRWPTLPFTDIDYSIYTDAARLVRQGHSPYDRATYRYTPLLAWLMLPTTLPHLFSIGKVMFAAMDVLVGWLMYHTLLFSMLKHAQTLSKHSIALFGASLWLFSPLSLTLSARGSSDVICVLLVTLLVDRLYRHRFDQAALVYGLAVHFKVYPVIYALALLVFIDAQSQRANPWHVRRKRHSFEIDLLVDRLSPLLRFGAISLTTFTSLNLLCYSLYGMQFVNESYLHHLNRLDTRHNFSMHFYSILLESADAASRSVLSSAVRSLPQLAVIVYASLKLTHYSLPLALYVMSVMFVHCNKVMTAQYFVWYTGLLPLLTPQLTRTLRLRHVCALCAVWLITEAHWLVWAAQIELSNVNAFSPMWVAAQLFYAANVMIAASIVKATMIAIQHQQQQSKQSQARSQQSIVSSSQNANVQAQLQPQWQTRIKPSTAEQKLAQLKQLKSQSQSQSTPIRMKTRSKSKR